MAKSTDVCMLIDQSLCVNCEACTAVCKQIYNVSPGLFRTKIHEQETGSFPEVISAYNKKACLHCTDAACVMACPTGALGKVPNGLTVINNSICIKCNYCAANCPYGAISFDRSKNVMEKCDLCFGRIEEGLDPFCAEVCTTRAIKYGSREEMMVAGQNRVADLQEQGFAEANFYGVQELGGLGVLTVLTGSPDKHLLPVDPTISGGLRIWRALPLTPIAVIVGGTIMAFNFLHSRKVQGEVQKKQSKNK